MSEKATFGMGENGMVASTQHAHSQSRRGVSVFKTLVACMCIAGLYSGITHEPLINLPRKSCHSPGGHQKSWQASKPIYRSPNSTIGWHVCPDNPPNTKFYCAFLETPLNWLEVTEKSGERDWRRWDGGGDVKDLTRIFLRMLPADDDKRIGSMLLNPGGPGGSGNALVYRNGPSLKVITEGKYDLIGFDPRGVNLTTPRMEAFETEYDLALFSVLEPSPIYGNDPRKAANISDPAVFGRELSRMSTLDTVTKAQMERLRSLTTLKARKSMSTPFVVRDMVAILDALGENDGLLNYWGFSYGTILGAHFAAMRPDRVGRMVLDGVSHAGDYTSGMWEWGSSSMTDSNAVYKQFFIKCVEAGHPRCDLAARVPNRLSGESNVDYVERSAKALQSQVDSLISTVWDSPVVGSDGKGNSTVILAEHLSLHIFSVLYKPASWQQTATAFNDLLDGNATTFHHIIEQDVARQALRNPVKSRKANDDNVFHEPLGQTSAQSAILCADAEDSSEIPLEAFVHLNDKLRRKSVMGDMWNAGICLKCHAWTDRPFERYPGPWTEAEGLRPTKNPLLWIGNTYDPVTPLASARRMAEGFGKKSSRLLVQNSRGHCTISEPSLCTVKIIADYLIRGIIPEDNQVCEPEPGFVFPEKNDTKSLTAFGKGAKHELLWQAMLTLSEESPGLLPK